MNSFLSSLCDQIELLVWTLCTIPVFVNKNIRVCFFLLEKISSSVFIGLNPTNLHLFIKLVELSYDYRKTLDLLLEFKATRDRLLSGCGASPVLCFTKPQNSICDSFNRKTTPFVAE